MSSIDKPGLVVTSMSTHDDGHILCMSCPLTVNLFPERWKPKKETRSSKILKNVLVSSISFVVKGPPYLSLPRSMREGNVILPVSECTVVLRTVVLPGILEYNVDCGEGIVSSWLNSELPLAAVK